MGDINGWIVISRQLQEHWLWDEKPFGKGQAWIDLLFLANYKDKKKICKGEIVTCKRGDVNYSISFLADRWGWDRKTVRRFLAVLESDGMVTVSATTQRTTITIENYDLYNNGVPTDGTTKSQQSPSKVPAVSPQQKKENKENKEKNIDYLKIISMYNETCVSLPKVKALSESRKTAIRARLNTDYTYEDFEKLFEKAQASNFLKGANNHNWRATFDWLIKDSKMAKVLEGNYDNRRRSQQKAADELDDFYKMAADWAKGES